MKITKNLLETLAGVMATKITEVSPKGNYRVVKEANKETAGHQWQADQHKAEAAKHPKGSAKYHFAMAAHHESMAEYHASNGHHNLAAHHDDKAEDHIEKAHGVNEETMTPGQKERREDIVKGLKKNAEDFKKRYGEDWEGVMYATATKKAMTEESVEDILEELLGESDYRHLHRGESSGRHYKDEHGVTWDDEGHNSAGTGPSDRAYHHAPKHKYPPKQKHYHTVPYAKKEEAKGEGMRWDGDKKKWYHTDAGKSATSKFKKLQEEVELVEDHKVGDKVHYTKSFGSGPKHRGVITGVGEKNDEKVYDVKLDNGDEHWGYHHQFKKIHEEVLDEALGIYVGSRVAKKKLLGGEKYGSATPSNKTPGHHHVKWDDGSESHEHPSKLKALNSTEKGYWDNKGGPPKHLRKEEVELDEEAKKADKKPVPGELNKQALETHLTKHEKHFLGFDNVRAKEAIADIHKMRSIHPSKLINGLGAHLDHLKDLTGFVQGSNKKPELTEEMVGEMFNRDTGHSAKDSEKPKGHLISVTLSEPDHPAVSKRKEQNERKVRVRHPDKEKAMAKAKKHYQKLGYKVHEVNHVKHLWEEAENDFGLFAEEFNTREQAEKAMEKHEKKHPLAKHSVMQGRRSGKWHVVRHTMGGMHVVEDTQELDENFPPERHEMISKYYHHKHAMQHAMVFKKDEVVGHAAEMRKIQDAHKKKYGRFIKEDLDETEEYILEGDESEADFQSYLKAHRAGLDHHTKQDADIDNDGKKNDPNDKYIRNRRAEIAKSIAKGKK